LGFISERAPGPKITITVLLGVLLDYVGAGAASVPRLPDMQRACIYGGLTPELLLPCVYTLPMHAGGESCAPHPPDECSRVQECLKSLSAHASAAVDVTGESL
jgi:hypothetical protein